MKIKQQMQNNTVDKQSLETNQHPVKGNKTVNLN